MPPGRMLARAAWLLGLALAGCDFAQPETLSPVPVAAHYKEEVAFRPAQQLDALPRNEWWHLYHDTQLDALEAAAGRNNPALAAQLAVYDQARAYAQQAEAGLYPTVTLQSSLSENKQSATRPLRSNTQPSNYGANTVDMAASYEIDFWGKLRNEARSGQALAQAGAADLAQARLSLQAEVADDYVVWRGLRDQERLLRNTVAAYDQALTLVNNRFQGQIASLVDVSRARTQLEDARAQVADIIARRLLLEHAIATLVGQPATTFALAPDDAPLPMPMVPPGVPSRLLERRPDIAAAERRVAAAAKLVGVAHAAYYPDISLQLLGGFQSTNINMFALPNSIWTLGSGLALPILDGGLRDAQLSSAQAALRSSTELYRGTVLAAFQDVEDNLALIHWLGEEQAAERAAVAAAQLTQSQALALFRDGATTFLEVVVAQTAALGAEQNAIALHTRELEATVQLIRALGGGWNRGDLPAPPEPGLLHAGP
jgi:NodT family efflux transporter outer membrane factor (OMF) lipoprotein